MRTFDLWHLDLVENNIPVLHSLSPEWVQKIFAKESLNVPNIKVLSIFFPTFLARFMPFYWEWKLALGILSDFPAIRSLNGLNDLNSLSDLSGLNDLNSLISWKHLLIMMLPLTWQQNDQYWSLNVAWIIKNPLFYGVLALFLLEAVEAMDVTFNQIQGS